MHAPRGAHAPDRHQRRRRTGRGPDRSLDRRYHRLSLKSRPPREEDMTKRTWLSPWPLPGGRAVARSAAQLAAGDPATNFVFADWVTGMNSVTDIAFLQRRPGGGHPQDRAVMVVSPDGRSLKRMAANMTVDSGSEKGLLGVVLDGARQPLPLRLDRHRQRQQAPGLQGPGRRRRHVTVDLDNPAGHRGPGGPGQPRRRRPDHPQGPALHRRRRHRRQRHPAAEQVRRLPQQGQRQDPARQPGRHHPRRQPAGRRWPWSPAAPPGPA